MAKAQTNTLKPKDPFRKRALLEALLNAGKALTLAELNEHMGTGRTQNPSTLLCTLVRDGTLGFLIRQAATGQPVRAYYLRKTEFNLPASVWKPKFEKHVRRVYRELDEQRDEMRHEVNKLRSMCIDLEDERKKMEKGI